jgi:opacity protein-like surface antigen
MTYLNHTIEDTKVSMVPASTVTTRRMVQQNSSNTETVEHVGTAGARPFGVAEKGGTSTSDQAIPIATGGIIPITAGATVTAGRVASDATGKAIPLTSAHEWSAGYAIMGGASGDTISVMFDPQPNTLGPATYPLVIPILFSESVAGAEVDTGWDLPAKVIVHDVYVDVTTAEATGGTKTIDVGTLSTDSGDANGFLDGVSVAAIAVVKGTLLNTGQTLGALLSVDEDGAGALVPEGCVTPGSQSISWTPGSNDHAEMVANLVLIITELV